MPTLVPGRGPLKCRIVFLLLACMLLAPALASCNVSSKLSYTCGPAKQPAEGQPITSSTIAQMHMQWVYCSRWMQAYPPTAANGRLFLAYSRPDGHIVALDEKSGQKIWEYTHKSPDIVSTSSPLVEGDLVYISFEGSGLPVCAVDVNTGQERWCQTFQDGSSKFTPLIYMDGMIYMNTEDNPSRPKTITIHALDARTGGKIWQRQMTSASLYEKSTHGFIYVSEAGGKIVALDTRTGKVHWEFSYPLIKDFMDRYVYPSLLLSGDLLYVSAPELGKHYYALNAQTGKVLYQHEEVSATQYSFVVSGDRLYLVSASGVGWRIQALDARTGEERWHANFRERREAGPVVKNGFLYIVVAVTTVIALDEQTGKQVWTQQVKGYDVLSGPVVENDVVFVGTEQTLGYGQNDQQEWIYALNARTGEILYRLVDGVSNYEPRDLLVMDNRLYVRSTSFEGDPLSLPVLAAWGV